MSTQALAETTAPDTGAQEGGFIDSIGSFFDTLDNPQAEVASTPEPEPQTPEAPEAQQAQSDFDELDATEPKEWSPQAARRFKELKDELKTYKQRSEEYEQTVTQRDARLQELEAIANNPEYENLQTKLAEYEQRTLLTDLENSNAYNTLIREPLMQLVAEADVIADKYGIDGDTLMNVFALTDEAAQEEQLGELLAAASDRDKFRIYKLIEDTRPILEQRRVLHENAAAALEEARQLDEERRSTELVNRVQQRQEAANAVAQKLRDKVTFLSSMEGVDLTQIAKDAALIDPATLDPVNSAYQAMAAKLLPKMAAQYNALQRELDHLTSQLADYDKATPKAGGGSLSGNSSSASLDNKSFVDAVAAAFGG